MKLLYPIETKSGLRILQNTGGKFTDDGEAVHIVGNLDLYSGRTFGTIEEDRGQYDHVASVPWQTFGGIYIKRQLLNQLNEFDRKYFWSYYRDVDFCLEARKLGWKILHTPVPFLHFEGKVNKQIQQQDPAKGHMAALNKQIFIEKWADSELTKNFYEVIS
jgi:GT2 family glycosyltransferase